MYDCVKEMPGPPCWKVKEMTIAKAPLEPQTLYWHDPVKCAHFLFQNPDFHGKMMYAPSQLYDESGNQVYTEMTTGEEWHYQQVCPRYILFN